VDHEVELIKGYSVGNLWTGVCLCGFTCGDGPYDEVKGEAEAHQRGDPPPPWIIAPGEKRERGMPRTA
jgi:hypothetical protein